jgi:hypothetical protein
MADSDVHPSDPTEKFSHASAPSSEEFAATGRVGNNARAGFRELPKETDEKVYTGDAGLHEAARDHAATRGSERSEPIERKVHVPHDAPPGAKYATTVKQAAEQLTVDHNVENLAHAAENLQELQGSVDVARFLANEIVAGKLSPEAAREIEAQVSHAAATGSLDQLYPEQPVQAESPQPAEASEPRSGGLSAKAQAALQTALSDPEARAAIEAPLMEAEAARARYAAATSELAGAAQAAVLAQYPELRQYPIHQLPAVLDYMSKNDPARHAAIMGSLNHAGAIMAAHKEATAEQQQIQRQQFQSWAKQQDDAFDKSLGAEISVEKKIAIQREIFSAAKESGISREQLAELWESNPVLRSAGFQKMMHDAALYRMAQRNLKSAPASRSQIPNVQKPGVAKAHGEADLAEIGDLRDQFKRASGQEQLRLAVKLHQMQRKARG